MQRTLLDHYGECGLSMEARWSRDEGGSKEADVAYGRTQARLEEDVGHTAMVKREM